MYVPVYNLSRSIGNNPKPKTICPHFELLHVLNCIILGVLMNNRSTNIFVLAFASYSIILVCRVYFLVYSFTTDIQFYKIVD